MIAAHFGLLDSARTQALINSAILRLLDPKIGIYSIYPMDLNKLKGFLKLKDDEAGMPYYYANGGVWAHANAWFALSLIAGEKQSEAFNFIKKIMTVDGITDSPNGQPAMYEYRISDNRNPAVYGRIDKPQFLWAAGWYIYSIYHLFGLRQSSWNIEMNPYLNEGQKSCEFPLEAYGRNLSVKVTGSGKYIRSFKIDGADYPSAVIPYELKKASAIDITLGNPIYPYIAETNSRLESAAYDVNKKELSVILTAFRGHYNRTSVTSPSIPGKILLNGKSINAERISKDGDGVYTISINFTHALSREKLDILF